MIQRSQHLKHHLNEQSDLELRHKIQCERRFSTGGSGTQTRSGQLLLDGVFKIQDYILKVFIDKIYLNAVDPDAAAAKKPLLRILIIIIIVAIIIILWYNKDI